MCLDLVGVSIGDVVGQVLHKLEFVSVSIEDVEAPTVRMFYDLAVIIPATKFRFKQAVADGRHILDDEANMIESPIL